MFNTNNNEIINVCIGIAGLVGVGYAIGTHTKLAKVSARLDKSIDEIADGTEIDIPEELVNKAVEKAVQTESRKAVERAANEAVTTIKRDIHAQIQKEIDAEYERIKETVLKEITASASKIDVSRVRREVEKAAKEAALKKFDDNLDDILEKFNDSLDNTTKIYSSIREAITRGSNSNKEFVVRLD